MELQQKSHDREKFIIGWKKLIIRHGTCAWLVIT
jgi:hypothetical protein